MKKVNFLSNLWSLLVGSRKDNGSTRYRLVIDSLSTRYRVCPLKLVSVFAILLTIGVGNVYATPTMLFQETFGDNGSSNTAVASATCYTATTSMFTSGHQTTVVENYSSAGKVGKNNVNASDNDGASGNSAVWYTASTGTNTNTLFQIQNINISGYTSLSLKFNLKRTTGTSAQNAITVKYQIDSNSEQTLSYTVPSDANWTWCTGDLSGTGSSLRITFSMKTTGGYTSRLDDIILTGTSAAPTTYTVTYDGNGNTSGSVPSDATAYSSGATVTVKGNTGSLAKTGYTFGGWNTKDDGTGINYTAGSGTFSISANTTLYAKWTPNKYTVVWKSNGSTARTDSNVDHGTAKTPPTISPLPCGDKLVGWTDAADGAYVHGTSTLYTTATITITGDKTFYAVFADYDD